MVGNCRLFSCAWRERDGRVRRVGGEPPWVLRGEEGSDVGTQEGAAEGDHPGGQRVSTAPSKRHEAEGRVGRWGEAR